MGSEREMRAAMFYLLYKSFFVFVFLFSSIVKLLLSQRGVFSEQVERQSELCVILSLSRSQRKTAALSTRKRCFFFFFFFPIRPFLPVMDSGLVLAPVAM